MAFIDARLNSRYLYGFSGGPQFNTLRTVMANGYTRKKRMGYYPLHRFSTNYGLLSPQEQEELLAAFWVCGGGFDEFRFKDYNDFRAVDQVIGVGDGTTDPLQLLRNYTFGSVTFSRPITLPLGAVVKDSDDNTLSVTVNPTTGMATPAAPWPSGKVIRWSGEFDVKVSFEEDYTPLTAVASKVKESLVKLVEVR